MGKGCLCFLFCLLPHKLCEVIEKADIVYNVYLQVMDQRNDKCLTLILDSRRQGEFHDSIQNPQNKQSDEIGTVHTWKLKWFSEEASLKFISVLKALYSTAAASSLPVKCIS